MREGRQLLLALQQPLATEPTHIALDESDAEAITLLREIPFAMAGFTTRRVGDGLTGARSTRDKVASTAGRGSAAARVANLAQCHIFPVSCFYDYFFPPTHRRVRVSSLLQ